MNQENRKTGNSSSGPEGSCLPNSSIPLFEQRVTATMKRCTDTFRSRGDQYGDTWRDCQHLALRAAIFQMFGLKPNKVQCEALSAGVMVDLKYQRMQGGYDHDHPIDGINYQAYFQDAMMEVYKSASVPTRPVPNGSSPP